MMSSMKKFLFVPALTFVAACETGLNIPDLRGSGDDRGLFRPAPEEASSAPLGAAPAAQSAKERLVAATEANGCVINISTIAAIMQQATVGNDELPGLVTELETEGRIAPVGSDGLRLQTPACSATS